MPLNLASANSVESLAITHLGQFMTKREITPL
jgi:hypothetical protein